MPDDDGMGGRRGAACGWILGAVAMMLFGSRETWAQTGYLQVRFEQLIAEALLFRGETVASDTSYALSYWTQNYQLDQNHMLGSWSTLSWQLGFQDRQAVERVDRVQVPYGHARLTTSAAGLYFSVKPVTLITAGAAAGPGAPPDTNAPGTVRVRSNQTVMTAYVTPARLPRAEVSWIRDNTQSGFQISDRRDARLSQQIGRFSWRAGYGDLASGRNNGPVQPFQRNYSGGAAVAVDSRPDRSLSFDYDFSAYDRGAPGDLRPESRVHRGTATGFWQQTRKLNWNLYGWYQRTESPRRALPPFYNGETQLYGGYQMSPVFRLQSGAQLRRAQEGDRSGLEGIFLASAVLDGPIRQDLRGIVDLSQSVVSNTFRTPYGVTTLRGYTQARLREGIDALVNIQAVSNSDTIPSARAATTALAGMQLLPLRTIQTTLRAGLYRIGPTFGEAANDALTGLVDVRWTPLQELELFGSLRRQESVVQSATGSTLRTFYARWGGSIAQLDVNYSGYRPDPTSATSTVIGPRSREIWTMHGIWNFDRARQLTAQVSFLDPHSNRATTGYDATFTWRFWL